jgi:dipeptidyl aminopeptidase/acylaminoacyl peptidase
MRHEAQAARGGREPRFTRRTFAQLLAAAGAAATALRASADTAPVPIENFFQNPAFGGPRLSPDGKWLAIGVAARNGRTQLVVIDLAQLTAKVAAGFADGDVWNYHWVNDQRLVYQTADRQVAPGETYFGPGLFAVDRDGADPRQLVDRDFSRVREHTAIQRAGLRAGSAFARTTFHQDSDDIFVYQAESNAIAEVHHVRLLRVNTRTIRATELRGPDKAVAWFIDAKDEPRVVLSREEATYTVHYSDPATGAWRVLYAFDAFDGRGYRPHSIGPDGTLFVTGHAEGKDTDALFRYDLAANKVVPEPVVSLDGYDFTGSLVHAGKRLAGVRYTTDAPATAWLDDKLKEMQRRVDALLPATINRLDIPVRAESAVVTVTAFSDRDPGTIYLFDGASGTLNPLGKVMRDIDPRRMAKRDLVRYKAGDGLDIPAWLTLPPDGGRNLPMVVLVHGGPWLPAATWGWRPDSQFLASRGYAVLEPDYRGTTGYGARHFRAGWKQWGLKMQSDIADGTRWAIAQGIADAGRICIAGASYGGYAALMGLVNDPDLYKCGINWVGVTDIEMMYTVQWSDASSVWQDYGMPRMVGDRVKDAEQLKKTSPLQQAGRITQPLLMGYGGMDRRVPIVHGTRLRDAVQQGNPNVEWVEYRLEGHGWALVQDRVDWWGRVEKFLAKHIGPTRADAPHPA